MSILGIFREHQVEPADTHFRRLRLDSFQIEHDSRAILTESPYDHPPRYFASAWAIQAPNARCKALLSGRYKAGRLQFLIKCELM